MLYRREGGPPLNRLPDLAAKQRALAAQVAFEDTARTLFPDCAQQDPSPPGTPTAPADDPPCWRPYAPDAASALAEQVLADLLPRLPGLIGAAESAPPPLPGPPYRGLETLDGSAAEVFFGRDAERDELLRRLRVPEHRFLAVVGASGTGKSSLVWAGLLPRLERGDLAGWRHLRLTPDGQDREGPLRALARALAGHEPFQRRRWSVATLAAEFQQDPAQLTRRLDEGFRHQPAGAGLWLFVDQFEELFRREHAAVVGPFLALLTTACRHPRLKVLLTLRHDFLPPALEQPDFVGLYNQPDANFTLTPPDQAARLEMVERPARRAGLAFEPGLAREIVAFGKDEPGALAMMAYTLERLYEARTDGLMTWAAYRALGGVAGSIGHHADEVYRGFVADHGPAAAEAALGALFSCLVQVDDPAVPPTRKRARRAELARGNELALPLAERLLERRLLVPDEAGAVLDVAHEALLQHWPALKSWIEGRKHHLRWHQQLQRAVQDWTADGCHSKHLRPGLRADLEAALAALDLTPTAEEAAFLDPARRAPWLLARDLAEWQAQGRPDAGLWDADRFGNFADQATPAAAGDAEADAGPDTHPDAGPNAGPGPDQGQAVGAAAPLLPNLEDEARGFLSRSFEHTLRAHPNRPRLRARCGNALAALGDPRFDPDHWWLPADATLGFREVPAGRFLLGSLPGEGWDDEQPQHPVDLPGFWIGRWPVTVAQYRAYLAATGTRPDRVMRLDGPDNHPLVLVTWYEARGYAHWLGDQMHAAAPAWLDRLGAGIRSGPGQDEGARRFWQAVADGALHAGLPAEAEWEKAARGPGRAGDAADDPGGQPARTYPWGEGITPAQANFVETRLGGTSAVGCFPQGAGPYGCEEQTGNVWEWTRSLWGTDYQSIDPRYRYPWRPDDGREDPDAPPEVYRVLRGGSFSNDEHSCRAAVRYRNPPLYRNVNDGVRLAWSPFL